MAMGLDPKPAPAMPTLARDDKPKRDPHQPCLMEATLGREVTYSPPANGVTPVSGATADDALHPKHRQITAS